jgi:hypothetical protein
MMQATDTHPTVLQQEPRLLLACLAPKLDGERGARVKELAALPLNWDSLLMFADRHWVVPLVYRNLRDWAADLVPERVMNYLASRFQANVQNSLFLAAHAVRVIDALEGEGIEVVTYKGPLLGEMAYGDLCLRQFCDIDLFLRRKDILRARDILRAMGFEPEFVLSPKEEVLYLEYESEYTLHHPGTGVSVELHWRVAPRQVCNALSEDELWNSPASALLLNRSVRTFATAENLLVLAVHNGSKHHWERLEWIVDVALLAGNGAGIDWGDLLDRTRRAGMKRILLLGLRLARDLLGAEFPPTVQEEIGRDRALKTLEGEVVRRLFALTPPEPGKLEHFLFSLRAREGIKGKLAYCAGQVTVSGPEDRRVVALPQPLSPLYGIIRLVRWLCS